ncbi:MAG: DUF2334 domain-containing protein [Euryarchaeota archaeon]|nr:DUF2334 domain-containing protein [Euryarchaeota archaeon]
MRILLWLAAGALLALPPCHGDPAQIWVEVHDASPGYGVEALDEVLAVLERHNIHRTVVFVIPNHAGATPLSGYPGFVEYLKEKESGGIELGAHGYTHEGFEFRCSGEEARELVARSKEEFARAGLRPRIFAPPRYLVTSESMEVLLDAYDEVYLLGEVAVPGGRVPSWLHDFSLGPIPYSIVMPFAKLSYRLNRGGVFRLGVHMGYANNPEYLEFLDAFLTWTDQRTPPRTSH